MAITGGVGSNEGGHLLEGIEIGLVVLRGLAAPIGVLVAQSEAQGATVGGDGRESGEQERNDAGNTHFGGRSEEGFKDSESGIGGK